MAVVEEKIETVTQKIADNIEETKETARPAEHTLD